MDDITGKTCPFCKTEIKEGDSVKICPSCGTPHHESCWEENKGCAAFGCTEQHCETQADDSAYICPNAEHHLKKEKISVPSAVHLRAV